MAARKEIRREHRTRYGRITCLRCAKRFEQNAPNQIYCGSKVLKKGCSIFHRKEYGRLWKMNPKYIEYNRFRARQNAKLEEKKKSVRAWQIAHPEKMRSYVRTWRAKNKFAPNNPTIIKVSKHWK